MKEILDKLECIKSATNHSFGMLCIFFCCCYTSLCVGSIESEIKKANAYLAKISYAIQDTIVVNPIKQNVK